MKRDDIPLELELQDDTRDTRTTVEKEEDWLYFHLACAARARARLERLEPSQEYDHEVHTRRLAISGAMKHVDLLRRMNSLIPPLLEQMLRAEGL